MVLFPLFAVCYAVFSPAVSNYYWDNRVLNCSVYSVRDSTQSVNVVSTDIETTKSSPIDNYIYYSSVVTINFGGANSATLDNINKMNTTISLKLIDNFEEDNVDIGKLNFNFTFDTINLSSNQYLGGMVNFTTYSNLMITSLRVSAYDLNNTSLFNVNLMRAYTPLYNFSSSSYYNDRIENFSYEAYSRSNTAINDLVFTIGYTFVPESIIENSIGTDSYQQGYDNGYQQGYDTGYYEGGQSGYTDGYDDGHYYGYAEGYDDGQIVGQQEGYDIGYTQGYNTGLSTPTYNFKSLFGAIADTPILFIRNLLGFEIFGVEALSILMTMITGCLILFLFRKIVL